MNPCRSSAFLFLLFVLSRAFQFHHSDTQAKTVMMMAPNKAKDASSTEQDLDNSSSNMITILGFGSLLSEKSSRLTFPQLQNFRLGRIDNYRRVFGHPASIFFQRNIANIETKEMSSLAAERAHGSSFVCTVFEVPNNNMMDNGTIPSQAFLEREEEFDIVMDVPYVDLTTDGSSIARKTTTTGILCTTSTDETYIQKWGNDRFQRHYGQYGISTIWGWKRDSGLRPCALYLRHCVLAAKSMGDECFNSFLDETYLVDRTTTLREYLDCHPHIMSMMPPPELAERYGG